MAIVSLLLLLLIGCGGNADTGMNGASPSRSKIAFTSNRDGNDEIYVIDADGTNLTRLTNNRGIDSGPAWSQDGTKLAFFSARDEGTGLCVMNADGTSPRVIPRTSSSTNPPTWSPDGTQLAYQTQIPYTGNQHSPFVFEAIFVVNADGTNPTPTLLLTGNPDTDPEYTWYGRLPAWSPDGTKIAYVTSFDNDNSIALMRPDGMFLTSLTIGNQLAWSPDGTRIVLTRGSAGGLYLINADGTALTQLTDHGKAYSPIDKQADWSPDGTQIVFVSDRDRIPEIYVMDADGTNIRRLTENPSYGLISDPHDSWPSWSPFLKED